VYSLYTGIMIHYDEWGRILPGKGYAMIITGARTMIDAFVMCQRRRRE